MIQKKIKAICFTLLCLFILPLQAQKSLKEADKIIGVWYNDIQSSKIKIYRSIDNKYYGKIDWLKKTHDEVTNLPRTDDLNPDKKLRNRPLIGLMILEGLVYEGGSLWENGSIYDPKNGKTYSVKISMNEGENDALNVRGFIGFSLIGRTSVWTRTEE